MTIKIADAGLKQEIGQLGFAAITLNGLIGGGIFALPALVAAKAGAFSPLLFLLSGALFMTIVLSFARLSRHFVHTGGPSVYVTAAFGPFFGFQTGWLLYLGRITAMAANANLMIAYLLWFFPGLNGDWSRATIVVTVIASLTAVNYVGVRQGLSAVLALSVLKLLPLALLLVVGLSHLSPLIVRDVVWPTPVTMSESMLLIFYAFVGFESGVINAGEGKKPQRDIAQAIIKAVVFTALLYFMIQWLAISVVANLGGSEQPLAAVARALLGDWGGGLIAFCAIVSILGNLSSVMIAAPRMSFAMARDHTLPAWFADIHPRFATPANSIIFVGLLSAVLAVSNTFIYLAIMSTLVRLVGYIGCIASLSRLEKQGVPRRHYLIPLVAILTCMWLMSFVSLPAWLTLAAFSVCGSVLYWVTRRHEKN